VTKPFSPRELTARVRAVLRRGRHDTDEDEILICGPVRMHVAGHVVTVRDAPVKLPLKEFQLLEVLLRNAGLVVTRARLLEVVWGPEYVGLDTKTLDVHVKRLRAKIEPTPQKPRHLITVRGLGYRFQPGRAERRSTSGSIEA
jgi:two-component system response regulator RegX3